MESASDLCRLCAARTNLHNRVFIYAEEGRMRHLPLKITSCIPLKLSEVDYLPKVLCKSCVDCLDSFYEFRSICIKTEAFFEQLFAGACVKSTPCVDLYSSTHVENDFEEKIDWSNTKRAGVNRETIMEPQDKEDMLHGCEASQFITSINETQQRTNAMHKVKEPFVQQQILMQPVHSSHVNKRAALFRCHYCKLLFRTRGESVEHLKDVHKKIHKCEVCSMSFRSVEALEVHRKQFFQHHKDVKGCVKLKSSKQKALKCKECGKEYKRNRELRLHERSHSGEKPFACNYCVKAFASASARNKHVQAHEKRWSHICNICGKGFVDRVHFNYHVRIQHTGERPFPCPQCDKRFVRKQGLQMHKENVHSAKPKQCYKCDICSKAYTTISYLKQHKQNHEIPLESRKKFRCETCSDVFLNNTRLKHHMLLHTGEMPYECELCKKRFNSKNGLKIHLLIHSGVKTFVCEVCSKAFALRSSLVCHQRTHTGERPYSCDICEQQFTQKSSLNTHRKRHEVAATNWQG